MKFPARFIAGNLIWSREGTCWAVWRITPTSYPYLSPTEKLQLHAQTRSALLMLPPESMILSLCHRLDPCEVVDSMIAGVDLDAHPQWRAYASQTLDALAGTAPFNRLHFLAVELPTEGAKRTMRAGFAAARVNIAEAFGLPPAPVYEVELTERRRQAEHLRGQLQSVLRLRDATPGEIRWVYARAPERGISDPQLDETWEPNTRLIGEGVNTYLVGPSLVTLGDGIFKEGGFASDTDRPLHRRYLRVETERGVGYQALLAISDMPHVFRYPDGAEWFFAADMADFPVDWCCRIRSIPNRDAQLKARRQARQLVGQAEEYEGEPSGPPHSLAEAAEGIEEYRAHLASNPADPELQCSLLYAVWADNLREVESRVERLRNMYVGSGRYDMHRPTGGQLALFAAMLPAVSQRPAMRDYTQYLLPTGLAAGAPFASAKVGDPRGMLLGYTLDGGTFTPVLFDPAYGISINRTSSLGAFGALGSGKSYFIKCVAYATLARGGQVVALDRTATGEYVAFAKVVPGRSQVVTLAAGSNVCLDPMRVFSGTDRINHTVGFLTLLTGVSPQDLEGVALEEAVQRATRRRHAHLADVVAELEPLAESDPQANVVYRKLVNYSRNELGKLVFGDAEVLELDADFICFHTPGLDLPRQEDLVNEHLYRQLLPRQIFSQALLYLVAAVARQVTFSSRRFGATLFDEAWSLTSSVQGRALVLEAIRDGRKHLAATWVLSQHPEDLGDDALAHLLGNRFVFRQSRRAAAHALAFLGMEPSERATQLLETAAEGRCLYRDVRDRIGFVQVLPAQSEALDRAFNTNPTVHPRSDAEVGDVEVAQNVDERVATEASRATGQVEDLLTTGQ